MKKIQTVAPLGVIAALLIGAAVTSLSGQANIPAPKQPELTSTSPALRKALDEVQRQCPTCATIDLARGRSWIVGSGQNRTQIDVSDGCSLAPWAQEQSDALRATLEHVFTGDTLGAFHSHTPTDCQEKTFIYYLGVARQVLDKVKPQ